MRLEYLDGLRALASLYVVLFHAGLGFSPTALPGWARMLQRVLAYGHDAVAVFIVLSGYCLMLPVARAGGIMPRALGDYFARRAWRILPPYYAALLGTLLLLAAIPILQTPSHTIWDDSVPAFAVGPIASHLLLVHNLFPAWVHTINGPLWSVATEWQIYFLFPLLLLPVWRKAGALAALLVSAALGWSLLWIARGTAQAACSWYAALFTLGMCAAGIGFAPRETERALRERVPWRSVSLVALALVAIASTCFVRSWFRWLSLSDALVGVATATLLLSLTGQALGPSTRPLALRVLEAPPLVALGRFSYSLYLTHLPVIALLYFWLRRFPFTPGAQLLLLLLLGLPASVLLAYLFFLVFERRFVGTPRLRFAERAPSGSGAGKAPSPP